MAMLREILLRSYRITGYTIIVLAFILVLIRLGAPFVSPSSENLTKIIKQQLTLPTTIQDIRVTFKGFSPQLTLSNVAIFTPENKLAVKADAIELSLNIPQLLLKRLSIDELSIQGATAEILHSNNIVMIRGLPEYQFNLKDFDQTKQSIMVKRLIVKNSNIDLFIDNQKKLPLTQVQLCIENKNGTKIRGSTTVLNKTPSRIHFGANIQCKLPLQPKETMLYFESDSLNLAEWIDFFPKTPLQAIKGNLGFKSWFQIKENQEILFTAQVKVNELEMVHSSQVLQAHFIEGWLQAQKKANDWIISGKNWEIKTIPGSSLSEIPLSFNLKREMNKQHQRWEFIAHDISIQKWVEWSKNCAFLPVTFINKIQTLQPQGYIKYLHLGVIEKNKRWEPYTVESIFNDVSIIENSQRGITGLSGSLIFDGHQGRCQLASQQGKFLYPHLFTSVLDFKDLSALIHFQLSDKAWSVQGNVDSLNVNRIPFSGNFALRGNDKKSPFVDMLFQTQKGKVENVLTLLPRSIMDDSLTNWLDTAIPKGEVLNSKLVLRGNLAHFPFDKQQGLFELSVALDNVELDYHKGWPALKSLTADLLFHNRSLVILGKKAEISGGKLLDAKAIIPDLYASPAQLTLDTEITNSLENAVNIIQESPLQATLSKTLSPLNLKGDMTLSLGLIIPLSAKSSDSIKVKGVIGVEEAYVKVKPVDLDIESIKGEVSFTENSIKSDDLIGNLFNNPTKFQLNSQALEKDIDLQFQASGHIKLDRLQRWLKLSPIKAISGEADYEAALTLSPSNAKPTQLLVHSSLGGISIHTPSPFVKAAKSRVSSQCKIIFDSDDHMQITAQYGNALNLAYSLILKNKHWEALGGHIHLGEKLLAQHRQDGILLVDGETKEINLQDWKAFFAQDKTLNNSALSNLKPQLDLKMENFNVYGASFASTKIKAMWGAERSHWNVQFEGPSLSGHIILPEKNSDNIVINIDQLVLTKNDEFESIFSNEKNSSERPIIELNIKKLVFNEKTIEKIEGRFEPSWKGYYFPNIKAKFKRSDITLSGQWDYLSPLAPVRLEGTLLTKNIHQTLKVLGLTSTLHKAKGTIGFSLQWNGTPAKIDYATLSGYANISLKQGYLYGVNPGMGRVLSLFNLDNVQRRLSLDFSDLTKDSLAFDVLTGRLRFGKGKISTNNILLKGPAAKIKAFGQADLENLDLNAEMIVMPNVTGSLPVAAAIAAGNPAIGAAVWVFDKVLGNKIQEIHQYRYKVLGSWSAPEIEEIQNYS